MPRRADKSRGRHAAKKGAREPSAELFDGSGSAVAEATVAVFEIIPATVGVTTTETETLCPTGSDASVHVYIGGAEVPGSPFTILVGTSQRLTFHGACTVSCFLRP